MRKLLDYSHPGLFGYFYRNQPAALLRFTLAIDASLSWRCKVLKRQALIAAELVLSQSSQEIKCLVMEFEASGFSSIPNTDLFALCHADTASESSPEHWKRGSRAAGCSDSLGSRNLPTTKNPDSDYLCSTLPGLANFPYKSNRRAHARRSAGPKLTGQI